MERPVECVLVVNDDGGIESNGIALSAFLSGADVGELGIFNADTNETVAAAALPTRHYYAVKVSTTEIRKSPTFNSAPTYLASDVDSTGSAGTTTISSFDGDCETEYILKVRLESEKIFQTYGYQDLVKTYSYVTRCCSDACGCPDGAAWDVAMGIAEQVNDDRENVMHSPSDYTMGVAKATTTNAVVSGNDFAETGAALTLGSNKVIWPASGGTAANKGDYGSNVPIVAGDFVRLRGSDGAVAITDDVFRVEAVENIGAHSATLTLDRPWPHASYTCDAAGDAEVIPKATAEALADSTWDIVIAGGAHATPAVGAISAFAGTFNSNFVTAHVGLLGGFDCNGTVTSTAPTMPHGQDWQISQLELKYSKNAIGSGNRPSPYRTPFPLSQLRANESMTASGTAYYVLSVTYADGHESAGTVVKSPYVVRLCIKENGTTTTYDNVVAVFSNGWNGISINSDGVIAQL